MDHDLSDGRLLRKNKQNLIKQSSQAVKRLEGFSGTRISRVEKENIEDIIDMEEKSIAMNKAMKKMNNKDSVSFKSSS